MKNKNFKFITGIIIGIIISGIVGVGAATVIGVNYISYDNSNSNLSSTNVQGALDELKIKADTAKQKAYEDIRNDSDLKTHVDEDGNSIYENVTDLSSLKKAINKDAIYSSQNVKEMKAEILNEGSSSTTFSPSKNASTAILVIYAHSGFGTSSGLTAATGASSSTMSLTLLAGTTSGVGGGTYGSSGSNYSKYSYAIYKVENVKTTGTISVTDSVSTRGRAYWALMVINDDLGENITKGKIIDSGTSSKTLFPSQNSPAALLVMYSHSTFGTSSISASAYASSNYAKMTLTSLKSISAGASGGTYGDSGSCYDATSINFYKVNNVDTAASLSLTCTGSTNAFTHWALIR